MSQQLRLSIPKPILPVEMGVLKHMAISSGYVKPSQPIQPFSCLSPSLLRAPPAIFSTVEDLISPTKPHEPESQTDSDCVESWELVDSTIDLHILEREEMNSFPREKGFWHGSRHEVDEEANWDSYEKLLCGRGKSTVKSIITKMQGLFCETTAKDEGLYVQAGLGSGKSGELLRLSAEIVESEVPSVLESCYELEAIEVPPKPKKIERGILIKALISERGEMDSWVDVGAVPETA